MRLLRKKKTSFLCVLSIRMLNLTLKELKSIANSRIIDSYKSMSNNHLIKNLLSRPIKVFICQ